MTKAVARMELAAISAAYKAYHIIHPRRRHYPGERKRERKRLDFGCYEKETELEREKKSFFVSGEEKSTTSFVADKRFSPTKQNRERRTRGGQRTALYNTTAVLLLCIWEIFFLCFSLGLKKTRRPRFRSWDLFQRFPTSDLCSFQTCFIYFCTFFAIDHRKKTLS